MKQKHCIFIFISALISFCTYSYSQSISCSNFTALSGSDIELYEKFEASFDITINGLSSAVIFNSDANFNLYNPSVISIDVVFEHAGIEKKWPAFFYRGIRYCADPMTCPNDDYWQRDGRGDGWRVRFTPDKIGAWNGTIIVYYQNSLTPVTVQTFSFNCIASSTKGFATIINNNQIKYSNGDITMAIGENIAYHPGVGFSNPAGANQAFICDGEYCYNRYARQQMVNWFEELSTNGGNYARVWFVPYSWELETWGGDAGNYDERQNRAFEFDFLLEQMENRNLLLHLVLSDRDGQRYPACLGNDPNIQNYLWEDNPYRNALGLIFPYEFFVNSNAINLFKNKIRYVIARWGYSPNLFCIEIMNEIDQMLYPCNPPQNPSDPQYSLSNSLQISQIADWYDIMASYIKSFDTRFLITGSTATPRQLDPIASLESVDFSASHLYSESMHSDYQRAYITQRFTGMFGKPTIIGETGWGNCWGGNEIARNSLHNTIWSNVFSGGFGTPLYWDWIRNHHPGWSGAFREFGPLSSYIGQLDFDEHDPYIPMGNARNAFSFFDQLFNIGICAPPIAPQNIDCIGFAGYDWAVGPLINNAPNIEFLLGGINTSNDASIEVFAMKNSAEIVGWLHNKFEYWYNLEPGSDLGGGAIDNGSNGPCPCANSTCQNAKNASTFFVPDLTGETLNINGVCNGIYSIEWYNTYHNPTASFTFSNGTVSAVGGQLAIPIPPLRSLNQNIGEYPDFAFKITLISIEADSWHNVLIASDPRVNSTIAIPSINSSVYYSDDKFKIQNWKWTPTGWINTEPANINNCSSGHIEASHSDKIYYKKCDGGLWEMSYQGNSWNVTQISNPNSVTGAIAVAPNGQIFSIGNASAIDHWYLTLGNLGQWNNDILAYNSSGDIEESASGQVYYRGNDAHLYQLSWNGLWNVFPISNSANQKVHIYGQIATSPNHDVFYRGENNQIHRWHWNGFWMHSEITPANSVCGDIEVNADGIIYYAGCDGHIYQLDNTLSGWQSTQITHTIDEKVYGDIEIAPDKSIFYSGPNNTLRRIFKSCGIQPNPDINIQQYNSFYQKKLHTTKSNYKTEILKNKSLEANPLSQSLLEVFPNPTISGTYCNICYDLFEQINTKNILYSVKLVSLIGHEFNLNLTESSITESCFQISIPDIPEGVYILKFFANNELIETKRIIVTK